MQTFLPYESFIESARVLDDKRLGKQRVENIQIMKALTLPEYGWKNHPAVKQWKSFELQLYYYHLAIVDEWLYRGFKDTTFGSMNDIICPLLQEGVIEKNDDPPVWLGMNKYHASHRSNLLSKDLEWYGQFGWEEPDDLPYWWPSKELEKI